MICPHCGKHTKKTDICDYCHQSTEFTERASFIPDITPGLPMDSIPAPTDLEALTKLSTRIHQEVKQQNRAIDLLAKATRHNSKKSCRLLTVVLIAMILCIFMAATSLVLTWKIYHRMTLPEQATVSTSQTDPEESPTVPTASETVSGTPESIIETQGNIDTPVTGENLPIVSQPPSLDTDPSESNSQPIADEIGSPEVIHPIA